MKWTLQSVTPLMRFGAIMAGSVLKVLGLGFTADACQVIFALTYLFYFMSFLVLLTFTGRRRVADSQWDAMNQINILHKLVLPTYMRFKKKS